MSQAEIVARRSVHDVVNFRSPEFSGTGSSKNTSMARYEHECETRQQLATASLVPHTADKCECPTKSHERSGILINTVAHLLRSMVLFEETPDRPSGKYGPRKKLHRQITEKETPKRSLKSQRQRLLPIRFSSLSATCTIPNEVISDLRHKISPRVCP